MVETCSVPKTNVVQEIVVVWRRTYFIDILRMLFSHDIIIIIIIIIII